MKKATVLFILICVFVQAHQAQKVKKDSTSVYKVNRAIELPATGALFLGSYFGFRHLTGIKGLTQNEVEALDSKNVWKFDRFAAEQDASKRNDYHTISDIGLNSALALPLLFGLDKKIRKDWLDLLILYGETHGINNALYIGNASAFHRVRPFVYSDEVPMSERMASETQNSFFSGHTSTTATASFFVAKVFCDYHPELGNKKYLVYGAAVIPPAVIGYYRVRAMKHFPTDVITGAAVGAAVGILIPHLHKRKKETGLSWSPVAGSDVLGLTARYTFK